MSADLFNTQSSLSKLEEKGLIEKIHQDIANITRYRLTINGRTTQQSIEFVCV